MVANIPKKLHFNVLEKRIGEVEVWEDSSGTKLKHLCFEEHSACSKGQYDVCPF